jgi:hypothetical protein
LEVAVGWSGKYTVPLSPDVLHDSAP